MMHSLISLSFIRFHHLTVCLIIDMKETISSSWSDLPQHLLELIFQHLICRSWRALIPQFPPQKDSLAATGAIKGPLEPSLLKRLVQPLLC